MALIEYEAVCEEVCEVDVVAVGLIVPEDVGVGGGVMVIDAVLDCDDEIDTEGDCVALVVVEAVSEDEPADFDTLCELDSVVEGLTVTDVVGVGGGVTVDDMLPDWDRDSELDADREFDELCELDSRVSDEVLVVTLSTGVANKASSKTLTVSVST